MHIPSSDTALLDLVRFDAALEEALEIGRAHV